jgi:predicted naringenin-chalcone synthase
MAIPFYNIPVQPFACYRKYIFYTVFPGKKYVMQQPSSYPPHIAAIATAAPETVVTQKHALQLIELYYAKDLKPRSLELIRQFLAHESILTRRIAVDSPDDLPMLRSESPDHRIERFTRFAIDLGAQAAMKALDRAGVNISQVAAIIVNTCTGYICPGLSTYLIERLGLGPSTESYDLVGAGCGGALPNIHLGESLLLRHPGRAVLSIAVEICSATYQMADDPSLLISNAIFGDGAAAAVLRDQGQGPCIIGRAARFATDFRDEVRFVYKNGALHNRLSIQLPKIMRDLAPCFIREFLAGQGIAVTDVDHWALHPGGERILSGIAEELALGETACAVSRSILRDFGNMSSPTVLFALEKILDRGVTAGDRICAVAYGAGLSLHALLLRA